MIYDRREGESFDDYALRLYDHAGEYGLTVVRIAELLNKQSTIQRGESSLRMFYKGYKKGLERGRGVNASDRILSISDLHFPFALPISTFTDYFSKVDTLVLNGDIVDGQAISKFPKTYRKSPIEEIVGAREYLIDLIGRIHPKRVFITYGNHDMRLQSYLAKNLDSDLLELMPKTPLELIFVDGFNRYNKESGTKTWYEPLCNLFDDVEINYTDNWWFQYKNVIFCHPAAFSSGMMKTAENAMTYFRNEGLVFTELVMAHTHRLGEYVIGNTTLYEQGCCCDVTKNNYCDGKLVKTQKEGFLFMCLDDKDEVIRDETKLIRLN